MSGSLDPRSALIVVPCLNEERHLPALLAQLLAEGPAQHIVVADGGSGDRSREIVHALARTHPNLILMDNPARLQSAGINRAVERYGIGHRWLVRIDAHCDYPAGYVPALISAARRHAAGAVVVPMVSRGRSGFQIAAAAAQNSVIGTGGSPHRHVGEGRFVDHGHHALIAIDLFRAAGGYDESMATNEDAELDCRIGQAGGRIWLEPSLALSYHPRSTPLALWRQYYRYGRGRAQTVTRHGLRLKLRQAVPLLVPAAAALALLAPLSWALALPCAAWAGLCLGAGAAIGIRAGSGWAMLSGVAAMIMHLGWGTGFLRERLFGAAVRRMGTAGSG
jgi:succinoglycan biosynthesis protein ExoA